MIKKLIIFTSMFLAAFAVIPQQSHAESYCLGTQCGSAAYNCSGGDCQWYEGVAPLPASPSKTYTTSANPTYKWVSNKLCGTDSLGNVYCEQDTDTVTVNVGKGKFKVTITARSWNSGPDPDEKFDVASSMWNGSLVATGPDTATFEQTFTTPTTVTFNIDHRPYGGGSVQTVVDWQFTQAGPSTPSNVTVVEGDADGGPIIQTRVVKVNWDFPDGGSGCGTEWNSTCPASNNKFKVSFAGPSSAPPAQIPGNTNSYTTGNTLSQNGSYVVTVCATNGTQESCTSRPFTKVPYPTGVVSGQLAERTPRTTPAACIAGIRAASANPSLNPTGNGYNVSCSINPSTGIANSYSCSITLDNQNFDPDPHRKFTIQQTVSQLYGSLSCGNSCVSNGSCTDAYTPDFDANGGAITVAMQNLYFNLNPTGGYYKVKNTSYYDHNGLSALFPVNKQAYDTDDNPVAGHFNRGETDSSFPGVGVVMTNGSQAAGEAGASNSGISPRGWTNSTYTQAPTESASKVVDYIKNRKDYATISSLNDAKFTGATFGTFIYEGDLTISPSNATTFNNKNVMIVATGKIAIETNLNPVSGAVAMVGSSVYINEGVSEVHALLVGDTISLVSEGHTASSDIPLKIVGSISSGTAVNVGERSRPDAFKPSLFIVSNPDAYSSLLSIISITRYDWTQIQ